ncbi:exosome complex component CSL4, putative (CSL4) [Plasmodium malariae]|uniref:Exosome complex component CSL4, putative (CSL4) n=1 Tax=Plasmodium malariae TaxID=5858 RepID=A0A1A8VNF6_PLAMA|nr:exosome complex component CSL4, putative (CSL4) [Plasmodium malariae]
MDDTIVLPGEVIGSSLDYICGENTYVTAATTTAATTTAATTTAATTTAATTTAATTTTATTATATTATTTTDDNNGEHKKVISVDNVKHFVALPKVGDVVICKIYRVTFNIIYCHIILSNNKPLKNSFKGYINKSDIHIYEGELGDNFDCFKQGDIIKAKVLSIGQHSSYKLCTVGSDLGVIIALSDKGDILKPVAWNLMINVNDMSFEQRKVSNDFSVPI